MLGLNSYKLFKQLLYLLEVQDHLLAFGFVGVFYLLYYQLGVTAHFQLTSFHGVGEVKPSYDSLIFGLVIGGLEAKFERIFHIYPVWRGQDQICTASLSIGCPVDGQPPYGEVERQLGSFSRFYWGEFHDEICQDLPFISLPKVSCLCSICFIEYSVGTSMI